MKALIASVLLFASLGCARAEDWYQAESWRINATQFQNVFAWDLVNGHIYKFRATIFVKCKQTSGFALRLDGTIIPRHLRSSLGTRFHEPAVFGCEPTADEELSIDLSGTVKATSTGTFTVQIKNNDPLPAVTIFQSGSIMTLEEISN